MKSHTQEGTYHTPSWQNAKLIRSFLLYNNPIHSLEENPLLHCRVRFPFCEQTIFTSFCIGSVIHIMLLQYSEYSNWLPYMVISWDGPCFSTLRIYPPFLDCFSVLILQTTLKSQIFHQNIYDDRSTPVP